MTESYEAPQLTVVGSLENLTAATHLGTVLDGTYPQGTPLTDPILS